MGVNSLQVQIQTQARMYYQKAIQSIAAKHGGVDHIPPEIMEKVKQSSVAQATQNLQNSFAQRRAQAQMMQQQAQHQAQQQQQQQQQLQLQMQQQQMQQQQMQGMNGMMGHQGM
ncbi:hypothetical protein B0T10DRAFT_491490 [Thelonectria olida]|uniref:Uncharacterized protein n=1 Tax=Thelonectria olida TaxID=1576542 RepID=A0A9P8VZL7_9HYPO|nr:hypothetical protein B0T10DRAFT_491490 [Thelonectria olida]